MALLSGCTDPPEDVASKIQAKYDSMSSFEMEVTSIEVTGTPPSYDREDVPLPELTLGLLKVQKPDKYFIEYSSIDVDACLGNARARYFRKGDIGKKWIFNDNSLCTENVSRRFEVYDIVIEHIRNAEISKEMLDGTPVVKASINLKVNTGIIGYDKVDRDGEESLVPISGEEDLILTYWFDADSYLVLQYQEEIPALDYIKLAKFNIIGINNVELPSGEDGILELVPSSDSFELIIEEYEDNPKIDEES